jgi:NCS1 family nucleobase:cation symporter-1
MLDLDVRRPQRVGALTAPAASSAPAAFTGRRPRRPWEVDRTETAGIDPVPPGSRYGRPGRLFAVWLSGDLEISAVAIGVVGPLVFGLSFTQTAVALVLGITAGAAPVAWLNTWGPKTGTAQITLARIPFGKSVLAPGTIQWASAIGWVAIGALFGAQAAHLLFHVPFAVAAVIVIGCTMAISIVGYEAAVSAQKIAAWLMPVLFAILTWRIFSHHLTLAHATAHGGAAVGGFIAMVTVAASGAFSWASYGSDYSRYLPENASPRRVFWAALGGLVIAYVWLAGIGAAAASVLANQTAAGIRDVAGGGGWGELALVMIVLAAIVSSALNDYSGGLALQSVEIRVKRPLLSLVAGLAAFGLVMWMNAGASTSARFTNVLLLTGYWCAPFLAVIAIDWRDHKRRYRPSYVRAAMEWPVLRSGWPALTAFAAGCASMLLFMDTSLLVGPVARAWDGADIAYPAGFAVTAVLYWWLRRYNPPLPGPVTADAAGPAVTAEGPRR